MAISQALIKGKISDGTVPSKHGIKRRASPSAKAILDVFTVFIALVLLSVVCASLRAGVCVTVNSSACVLVCRSVVLTRVLLFTVVVPETAAVAAATMSSNVSLVAADGGGGRCWFLRFLPLMECRDYC